MADAQDGARGAPGTKEWVKSQLEKVARALGEDIVGCAQIHECAMAHICVDPNSPGGRRAALGRSRRRGGVLQKLTLGPWTYSGVNLHIGVTNQGNHDDFWDPSGKTSKAAPKFYKLVSHETKGAGEWKAFRTACLAQMQLPSSLDDYETAVGVVVDAVDAAKQLDSTKPICPLPLQSSSSSSCCGHSKLTTARLRLPVVSDRLPWTWNTVRTAAVYIYRSCEDASGI